ncbi:MAG: metal ABC transporter solute-binding protein, Zn/Mn family, partial [Microthrixaceae bacterium]
EEMRDADVLVVNGLGFEVGLVDTIEAARGDGVVVIEATDWIAESRRDPHFFTDPETMASALNGIGDELADHLEELNTPAFRARVADYQRQLADLSVDLKAILAPVPDERRLLVTNHEVFGAFADRYDFEVLGTVIPAASTLAEPSAAGLHALAGRIAEAGVPAIFAETSSPTRLAEALAAEGAGVRVVELYTESLGPPGSEAATYLAMMRTNATRIATALS